MRRHVYHCLCSRGFAYARVLIDTCFNEAMCTGAIKPCVQVPNWAPAAPGSWGALSQWLGGSHKGYTRIKALQKAWVVEGLGDNGRITGGLEIALGSEDYRRLAGSQQASRIVERLEDYVRFGR